MCTEHYVALFVFMFFIFIHIDMTMLVLMVMAEKIVAPSFTVDLNKPIAFQVGYLGEHYHEWVHTPILGKHSPRFYESDFWEFFSRTPWWAIPIIWLPVVYWFLSSSFRMGHTVSEMGMMIVGGMFLWTPVEYILHRCLFHMKTSSYWGNTIHYILHGFHHKHPMDGLRLVFPPVATAVACIPLWEFAKLIATPSVASGLFGGGLLGYVIYDCTHYYLHYGQPTSGFQKHLKKDHLNHHFRVQDKGYGVTSSLWDIVFGTLPPAKLYGKKSE